jgi:hypothetical protein
VADSDVEQNEFSKLFRERELQATFVNKADGKTEDQAIASTHIARSAVMNRLERDIVLAGILLDEQLIDERQLARAVSDWTIHGSEPLLEHLVAAGVVSSSDGEALVARVTTHLQQLN